MTNAPYRIALESPGTLVPGAPTWLRVYIESQVDRSAPSGVKPTIAVIGPDGTAARTQVTTLEDDPNIHEIGLTFARIGTHEVVVRDGVRDLARFGVAVQRTAQ